MSLLADQVCIVSGAGQGLGRSISLEMAREGATVVMLERNRDTLQKTAEEIRKAGGRVAPYELDVTDYESYRKIVEDVVSKHGRIDAIVNNAGINPPPHTILTETLENWRRTIAINLEAVQVGSQLVARYMVERHAIDGRGGRIVHIASIQGFASSGEVGSYNAAKGAMIALTKSMAVELGRYDILVNAVAPGFISTPMSVINGVDETTTPEFVEWYCEKGKIPLRRSGTPEDVSGTVVFLCSSYCRYMTGQLLVVDGGLMSTF